MSTPNPRRNGSLPTGNSSNPPTPIALPQVGPPAPSLPQLPPQPTAVPQFPEFALNTQNRPLLPPVPVFAVPVAQAPQPTAGPAIPRAQPIGTAQPIVIAPQFAAHNPAIGPAITPLANRPLPVVNPAVNNQPVAAMYARPAPVATPVPTPLPTTVSTPLPTTVSAPLAARPVSPVPIANQAVRPILVGTGAARPIPVSVANNSPLRTTLREQESDEEADVEKRVLKSAPPWLVSLVVHMVMLLIMGLIVYHSSNDQRQLLELVYAEEFGVQLEDPNLNSGLLEMTDLSESVLSNDTIEVSDPFAAPPIPDPLNDANAATMDIQAPIGMALTGREKGKKEALLGKYGGTALTEEAVKLGLEWLKKNQGRNGLWRLDGPYRDGGGADNPAAATAMALLAFQGAGNTHKEGPFRKEVEKGWAALLALQDRDGMFAHNGRERLYTQAQCTIAICELYGMTKDASFKKPAQLAVDYAVRTQSREGGWRYTPGEDADLSVTGWFVMALQSARMAGLDVPSPTLDKISAYLDTVSTENGSRYFYRSGEQTPTVTMTAEALLCRQYLQWSRKDPRLQDGVDYILQNPIDWAGDKNVYYWYYATQVTHHMEGEHWKKWNEVMRTVLPKRQEKTGSEAGSWSPDNDRWGLFAGRLYETCLCIYMLEVYYRHLPIYSMRGVK